MNELAQVGDTVRLTIVLEGQVIKSFESLTLGGFVLYRPNHTVEILSHATPPLPSEPGTYWLDRDDCMWTTTSTGVLFCSGHPDFKPQNYAPFRQLVLKV